MSEEEFVRRVMDMRARLYCTARGLLWNDEDAADAVQEAMLRAWKAKRSLRDEARFEAWFMRIFLNQCRDMQRGQIRRRQALRGAEEAALARGAGEPGVFSALWELPERLRLPAMLFYLEGYTQAEVARMLDLSREQVNTRLRQARGRLRSLLTEGGEE